MNLKISNYIQARKIKNLFESNKIWIFLHLKNLKTNEFHNHRLYLKNENHKFIKSKNSICKKILKENNLKYLISADSGIIFSNNIEQILKDLKRFKKIGIILNIYLNKKEINLKNLEKIKISKEKMHKDLYKNILITLIKPYLLLKNK